MCCSYLQVEFRQRFQIDRLYVGQQAAVVKSSPELTALVEDMIKITQALQDPEAAQGVSVVCVCVCVWCTSMCNVWVRVCVYFHSLCGCGCCVCVSIRCIRVAARVFPSCVWLWALGVCFHPVFSCCWVQMY